MPGLTDDEGKRLDSSSNFGKSTKGSKSARGGTTSQPFDDHKPQLPAKVNTVPRVPPLLFPQTARDNYNTANVSSIYENQAANSS